MSPAVHGGGPRWKSFEYNTLLSLEPFREERIMDANRYFTAMHNACRISAATTPTWKSGGCPGSTAPPCVTPRWAAED